MLQEQKPVAPKSAIARGLHAVFTEHRLPDALRGPVDRLCRAVGLRTRIARVEGLLFRVRRQTSDESFVRNVVGRREYNPEGYEIGNRDTVIDIGGNIGTFAIVAAQGSPAGRVLSFEPDAENFRLLKANVALNGVAIEAHQMAVAAASGHVTLFTWPWDGGHHTLIAGKLGEGEREQRVPAISLSEIFDRFKVAHCDFLKLDCEGAEYEILGALPEPYWQRIGKISMEYHGKDIEEARVKVGGLCDLLRRRGFRIDAVEEHAQYRCGHLRATHLV